MSVEKPNIPENSPDFNLAVSKSCVPMSSLSALTYAPANTNRKYSLSLKKSTHAQSNLTIKQAVLGRNNTSSNTMQVYNPPSSKGPIMTDQVSFPSVETPIHSPIDMNSLPSSTTCNSELTSSTKHSPSHSKGMALKTNTSSQTKYNPPTSQQFPSTLPLTASQRNNENRCV